MAQFLLKSHKMGDLFVRKNKMGEKNSTSETFSLLPKLIEAGLLGNRRQIELLALNVVRRLRSEQPIVASEVGSILAQCSSRSQNFRAVNMEPPPSDEEGGLSLVRFQETDGAPSPIFPESVNFLIERFIQERVSANTLLRVGLAPPRSILLKGPPGTGKTSLAKHIAAQLQLRLFILDLATSVSSYLGKTGNNLRRSFDYARSAPCVLLLDEFDAIAKRRDDPTEVGELKRIVNVLLKEMEEWPNGSVLIAATNHPELLDPAIHRRFDMVLDIPLPTEEERHKILTRTLGCSANEVPDDISALIAILLEGKSGSEIETFAQAIARRHVLDHLPMALILKDELQNRLLLNINKKDLGHLIKRIQTSLKLTVRETASLLGKGPSTIQYHLKRKQNND